MLKAAFIDIDNTLLDFDAYVKETLEKGFEHFNLIRYEPWMFSVFTEENTKLWLAIEDGTLTFPELEKIRFNIVFNRLGIDFDGIEFEKYFRSSLYDSAVPIEGAVEMLEALSRDMILCAASNGPYDQQIHRLQIAGMYGCFSHVFISEEIGFSKPSDEYFRVAFSRLGGILPSECIMIGDSETSDMQGAVGAGMKTCFYNPKKTTPSFEYDLVVSSLDEVYPGIMSIR